MQFDNKKYDAAYHDKFRALTVKQPYADDLVTAAYTDDDGHVMAIKTIEVRSKNTQYRGDLLICSSKINVFELFKPFRLPF